MLKKLKEVLYDYELTKSPNQGDEIYEFMQMMMECNKIHNLTAITEPEAVLYKHIVDSLLPIGLFKDGDKVIDIGCGAGFPSVPLALLNKKLKITAIDSVGKKTNFVQYAKDKLNIENLTVIHTRAEDLARTPEHREQYDVVISRALAPLNIVIEYSAPFLKTGGFIFAYKGPGYPFEVKEAERALKLLRCKIVEVHKYDIHETGMERYILRIEKTEPTLIRYPRIKNKPRTKPL